MQRVAIYSRYSSDRQSETSAEDQARLCVERAEREGWDVVARYADEAISGAKRDRPGLNALLANAADFDIVLAESIDRLSRDQEDIAAIHKRLTFAGVRIVTLADGEVSELHIGLKGTMGALFLKDLAAKTRRGQIGRVAAGRIPGGLSYGYRAVRRLKENGDPERGLREIDEDQAAVVRRIFTEFAAGISPLKIAHGLNANGIAAPRGGHWRASVLLGTKERQNGILRNSLFKGEIVFNRQRFDRDPITRRRVARPNPEAQWIRHKVPALRIVDEALWNRVHACLAATDGLPLHRTVRPKTLLSGLLVCGECGGVVSIQTRHYWGCGTARQTGTCSNRRMIATAEIEARVMKALKEDMAHPDAIAAYVRTYHKEMMAERKSRARERGGLEKRLRDAEARVARLAEAIASGAADFAEIRDLLKSAKAERDMIAAELADVDDETVVELHPGIVGGYRRHFDRLSELRLDEGLEAMEASEAIRGLIERIVVRPRDGARGVDLEVQGRLAAMIAVAEGKPLLAVPVTVKLVAGAGSRQQRNYTLSVMA